MLKRLSCTLLLAGALPLLAQAQLAPYIKGSYRLKDGTTGEGKLWLDNQKNLLLVKKDNEKLSYPLAQVDYYRTTFGWMKSVGGFTMRATYGDTPYTITEGFATVLDTGRVELMKYTMVINGHQAGPEYRASATPHQSFLLRPAGATTLVTVRNGVTMTSNGKFDEQDQQTLLRVFGNDAELQRLLADSKFDSKAFVEYVRAYNRRKG